MLTLWVIGMLVAAKKAGPLFPQAHGRGDFCRAWEMPAASPAEPAGAQLLAAHPKRGHMEGEAAPWCCSGVSIACAGCLQTGGDFSHRRATVRVHSKGNAHQLGC